MDAHSDLKAPVFLMAMPQVQDRLFSRSVVLLVHHDEQGSLGFILNCPTQIKVGEILAGMEIAWQGEQGAVAHIGGPVQPQVGSVLFAFGPGEDGVIPGSSTEVMPGLGLTQHIGDLEALAASPPQSFRFILGYAGWAEGQLLEELLRNDWLIAPVEEELVFASGRAQVWERALLSVGVDPTHLPPANGPSPARGDSPN